MRESLEGTKGHLPEGGEARHMQPRAPFSKPAQTYNWRPRSTSWKHTLMPTSSSLKQVCCSAELSAWRAAWSGGPLGAESAVCAALLLLCVPSYTGAACSAALEYPLPSIEWPLACPLQCTPSRLLLSPRPSILSFDAKAGREGGVRF